MKLVCISDTHCKHRELDLPEGDIIIHGGDFTNRGASYEILDFLEWFGKTDYTHRILIAGNHDHNTDTKAFKLLCEDNDIIYLCDSEIVIEGIKFYGSPVSPTFGHGWAWNRDRGVAIKRHWDNIPDDTDVLITHGPPKGILDEVEGFGRKESVGCDDLLEALDRVKPIVNIFGHIHDGSGSLEVNDVIYINAAICNDYHEVVNKPRIVEIIK